MKVKIKEMRANPFRDFEHYPRDEEKIKSLTKSVEKTGFWDNILARRKNGKIEIAYGHHRYVVLKRLFKPEDEVDISVKELDDWTMIMIMVDENMEEYGTDSGVFNEGIKAAFLYLKEHYGFNHIVRGKKHVCVFNVLSIPEKPPAHTLLALQIAVQLGDPRSENRVYLSLQQLEAQGEIELPKAKKPTEEGEEAEGADIGEEVEEEEKPKIELSKKAVKVLGKASYVKQFFNTLKRLYKQKELKIPMTRQFEVAKKLVSMAKFDVATIAKELVKSVQKKEDDTKEEKIVELEVYLRESSNLIGKLDGRVQKMLEIKDVLDSDVYEKSVEKTEFKIKAAFLIRNLQKLLGGKNEVRKLSDRRK